MKDLRDLLRALALGACLLGGFPAIAETPPATAPAIGDLPPAALGKDGKNRAVDLSAYRGKVVIVTFWASWCGYCLKELPALNALQAQAGDQWLKIIAVNVQDGAAEYRAMTRQMQDYKLLLTRDRDGDIAAGYGVKAYPNLWMIDPQGRVASHHVGYGEDSLQAVIDEIKRLLTAEMERQQAARAG
jgi:thiol-disulfide isomerase/thioredoxin